MRGPAGSGRVAFLSRPMGSHGGDRQPGKHPVPSLGRERDAQGSVPFLSLSQAMTSLISECSGVKVRVRGKGGAGEVALSTGQASGSKFIHAHERPSMLSDDIRYLASTVAKMMHHSYSVAYVRWAGAAERSE